MPLLKFQKYEILDFLKEYHSLYPPTVLNNIIENYENSINKRNIPVELYEIYTRLNIIQENFNIYLYCIEKIKEIYGLKLNILDLSGGYYPMFANYINKEQRKTKGGTITVYNPCLIISKLSNITLKKANFSMINDINSYDLITAITPNESYVEILTKLNECNKNLFLIYKNENKTSFKDNVETVRDLIYTNASSFDITEGIFPDRYKTDTIIFSKKKK